MKIVPTNNGEVFLEDEKTVSEGQREALKKNAQKATNWLKDNPGVNHFIYQTEDGILVSRMTLCIKGTEDLQKVERRLLSLHGQFYNLLHKWMVDHIEEVETPVEQLQKEEKCNNDGPANDLRPENAPESESKTFLDHPMLLIEWEKTGFSVHGNIPIYVAVGLLMCAYAKSM